MKLTRSSKRMGLTKVRRIKPSVSTKLRYNEYYDMQETLDWLYQRSLNNQMEGVDLYRLITSENNILLAYRTIKANTGSKTSGVDDQTIADFKIKDKNQFVHEIRQALANFSPQGVRRVEIPKPNGKTRPLGIPTMRDRLIQQMFLQILNPICEAKFHNHSYGFRNNRSTHHAISRSMFLINRVHCHYVVDVDIKGFFDNVNHTKLLHQLYTIGVKDKRVLTIIGKMLKAPIAHQGIQSKGTPQGAILSPLLSNVVLNDLDHWIESQWQKFPTRYPYRFIGDKNDALRKNSKLKEMYIVRYADDFKIFTKSYKQAWKIFRAVENYLDTHLKLEISKEKSRVTNLRKRKSEFLGFELYAVPKKKKFVAYTNISKKKRKIIRAELVEHLKRLQKSSSVKNTLRYNAYILGIHQYYGIATSVNINFSKIAYSLLHTSFNRLKKISKYEVPRSPPPTYKKFYKGNCRTYKINGIYLYPLTDIQWKIAYGFSQNISDFTVEGRKLRHEKLKGQVSLEIQHLLERSGNGTLEYLDNRISKYSMQNGKCSVSGRFLTANEVHCHHILPRSMGGLDHFDNLTVVHKFIHILIHATQQETIDNYLEYFKLTKEQLEKLNKYRENCNLTKIY